MKSKRKITDEYEKAKTGIVEILNDLNFNKSYVTHMTVIKLKSFKISMFQRHSDSITEL